MYHVTVVAMDMGYLRTVGLFYPMFNQSFHSIVSYKGTPCSALNAAYYQKAKISSTVQVHCYNGYIVNNSNIAEDPDLGLFFNRCIRARFISKLIIVVLLPNVPIREMGISNI